MQRQRRLVRLCKSITAGNGSVLPSSTFRTKGSAACSYTTPVSSESLHITHVLPFQTKGLTRVASIKRVKVSYDPLYIWIECVGIPLPVQVAAVRRHSKRCTAYTLTVAVKAAVE